MNTLNQGAPESQEIEALLPWHAAGTLNRRDRERVERALASDSELARRFDLVREEQHETIHLNESLGAPSSRAMEKLFAAIEADGGKAPARRSFDLVGRVSEFLSSLAPRTVAYAAGAAALTLFVQAAVLTAVVVKEQPGSGTIELSSFGNTSAVQAVIRFTPQTTASEITRFLNAHNAVVVDGPGRGGLFSIRFTGDLPKDEIVKLVQQMQSESRVVEFIATKE